MHIHCVTHSVSECQSDENGEFAIFFTKSVAMATFLEISKKEVPNLDLLTQHNPNRYLVLTPRIRLHVHG